MPGETKKYYKGLKKEYRNAIRLITVSAVAVGLFFVLRQSLDTIQNMNAGIYMLRVVFLLIAVPVGVRAVFKKLYIRASFKK